jgi:2-succinyl-5-enolpyruvyl-6-hydroxy-3-cyclohexene-1-carboxylate synthase
MTGEDPPNRNTLWAEALVNELAAGGLSAVCIAPGSRSTPLTVAFAAHDAVTVFSHFDERSASFFALGRARRTGEPTAIVCTSGTAAANFHPAVIEANQARVPLLVLTADRPPELRDSGANQTVDQEKLYGDAVRWYRDLPEPGAEGRKLRRLRTDAARALAATTGTPAGPVHLNVPFRKPLEPIDVPGDVPPDLAETNPLALDGREGPYVRTTSGTVGGDEAAVRTIADTLASADRGLIVAGPADPPVPDGEAIASLARAAGVPVLADPLSGARFGQHVVDAPILGGYDAYFGPDRVDDLPAPDVVVRFGASPTSKRLRKYLAETTPRQFLVDPAGEWREAEFVATDLVVADPEVLARDLASAIDREANSEWHDRLLGLERRHWSLVESADAGLEGRILHRVLGDAPDPSTVFVSNSMPVRDADRFGRPRRTDLSVLGNRGASGIDGIVSTALGAGSVTDDPLTLVTGDLAFYHDTNGLLALDRCDVDATIVLIHNDGGGIFHKLPIEDFDPPFTAQFKTPHGLDFEPVADLYDLDFRRVDVEEFGSVYRQVVATDGTQLLAVSTDAERSHRERERLREAL